MADNTTSAGSGDSKEVAKEATTIYQEVDSQATAAGVKRFPRNLEDQRECIRFSIRDRDDLNDVPSAIYLYTPTGFSLMDSGSYTPKSFGVMGGAALTAANVTGQTLGERGVVGGLMEAINTAGDAMLSGEGDVLGTAGVIATSQGWTGNAGSAALMKEGVALNPHQNILFDGTAMRSFNFNFKLIAKNAEDSELIRSIENTFRKYLYPEKGANQFVLKYPPYFQIQFLTSTMEINDTREKPKDEEGNETGEESKEPVFVENPYMPFLHLCYLKSLSATYNASTNAFHKGGAPTELDLNLSFDEAIQINRNTLYGDSDKYHGKRTAITSGAFNMIEEVGGDQIQSQIESANDSTSTPAGDNSGGPS